VNLLRMPEGRQGRLAENVMHFARVLRTAGIPVGTNKVLDALQALALAGIGRREDFYWTLASVFVDRREQRELFDQAFHMFWRDPDLLGRILHMMLPKVEGLIDRREPGPRRLQEAFGRGAPQRKALPQQPPQGEVQIDAMLSFSANERLERMDFETMTHAELQEARRCIARLQLPLRQVRTRRLVADARGSRVDARSSLRAAVAAHGGVIPLRRAGPRTVDPPLVVLVDVSGSMSRYTRMFLHFVHALANARPRVSVLLFGTRLTPITRELRQRDIDVALDAVSRRVPDWGGGTRIGACLREFNRLWSRRLLGQSACVLLMTDGLDREGAQGLGAQMERLHKSCRQLIWLNPLLRYEGFEAKAAGIVAMRPHADLFLPAHNLKSLDDLAQVLEQPAAARHLEARAA
jgi:hypothetical protein